MPIGIAFYISFVLYCIFRHKGKSGWADILLVVMLFLLGWHAFGFIVK